MLQSARRRMKAFPRFLTLLLAYVYTIITTWTHKNLLTPVVVVVVVVVVVAAGSRPRDQAAAPAAAVATTGAAAAAAAATAAEAAVVDVVVLGQSQPTQGFFRDGRGALGA